MHESVSDVIAARSRHADGLGPVLGVSVVAHVLTGIAVLFGLTTWLNRPVEPPPTVMTISLGGSPGPRTGGLTSIGGRTVQAPPPPEPVRRAETAPAARPPEMALPTREPARTRPQPPVTRAPRETTSRTPTTGPEPQEGPARAETQVRGQGFGLTTGGGGGSGVQLDVGNFCCPEYIAQMVRTIQSNWSSQQGVAGSIVMQFTILRSGMIDPQSIRLERSSGFLVHELAAQRALLQTTLPPLPNAYPNSSLGVHLTFEYSR